MARLAKRLAEIGIEDVVVKTPSRKYVIQQIDERSDVVSVKHNAMPVSGMGFATLAGVAVACKNFVAPNLVFFALANLLLELGDSTFPVPMEGTGAKTIVVCDGLFVLGGFAGVADDESGNAVARVVHPFENYDRLVAAALAKMLSLVLSNPLIDASIIIFGVIAGVLANDFVPFGEPAGRVSFAGSEHASYSIRFNGEDQEKLGELLERLPGNAGVNQQPSAVNGTKVAAKVQRLAGEEPTNNPATSAQRESDDIVHARRNAGFAVQALRYNGASVTVDQYAPAGILWFLNTYYIQFWLSTLPKYQFGSRYGASRMVTCDEQPNLIDSDPEIGNEAELSFGPSKADRDRLSGWASLREDATVGPHGNLNHENAAEMTASVQ